MKIFIADIQGFTVKNKFIAKEMTITKLHDEHGLFWTFLFKPNTLYKNLTEDEKTQIIWLENYHHGLRYSGGINKQSDIPSILKKIVDAEEDCENVLIFLKGHQKQKLFEQALPKCRIYNIEYRDDVPKLEQTLNACLYHINHCKFNMCTITNVKLLLNFVKGLRI